MITAELDTVTATASFPLIEPTRRQQLRAMLRDKPKQIRYLSKIIVQLEPSKSIMAYITTESVHVDGMTLSPSSRVQLCIFAINRNDTDELVIDRKVHRS